MWGRDLGAALATVDVLSRGRLIVGVGVGWLKEEFEVLGLPPFRERGSVTDEYIRIFKEVWTSERPEFHGKYMGFSGIKFLPKPPQKPHPPIWVGGESPMAMRRAAELGDGWFPIGSNPRFPLGTGEEMKSAIDKLAVYVERAGRRTGALEIGYSLPEYKLLDESSLGGSDSPFVGDADKIASSIQGYGRIGVSFIRLNILGKNLEETMRNMEKFVREVMPKVM